MKINVVVYEKMVLVLYTAKRKGIIEKRTIRI